MVRSGYFNPRTPCGVRPGAEHRRHLRDEFQSTHPLRGATERYFYYTRRHIHFNPRTPCGVRLLSSVSFANKLKFQSTHPLRGATSMSYGEYTETVISIHAPLAGCDWTRCNPFAAAAISIHAPLAGCDPRPSLPRSASRHFNPRTPCGVRLQRRE